MKGTVHEPAHECNVHMHMHIHTHTHTHTHTLIRTISYLQQDLSGVRNMNYMYCSK